MALWKINARTMLDAAKMLSAGEVLEDVSDAAERSHSGSLVCDGLEISGSSGGSRAVRCRLVSYKLKVRLNWGSLRRFVSDFGRFFLVVDLISGFSAAL